jgi:AAA+ ATPase superfamily predicted ATPase
MEFLLFDLRPKKSRKELFDRRKELEWLDKKVDEAAPLILVTGLRRVGKTSLLKSFLDKYVGIYLDLRTATRRSDLNRALKVGILESLDRLEPHLTVCSGLEIEGRKVKFKWNEDDPSGLPWLLKELSKRADRVVVVFDEAQRLMPPLLVDLRNTIAHIYDNLDNTTVIVSGSETGVLKGIINVYDIMSPLYGRYYYELTVEPFPRDLSIEFLKQGFREAGVEVPLRVIEEIVDTFGGIVGWLVFAGRKIVEGEKDIEKIKEKAAALAMHELTGLPPREKQVLKALAEDNKKWKSIRNYIIEELGVNIPKPTVTQTLRRLEQKTLIKNFDFIDPVYKEAAKKLGRDEVKKKRKRKTSEPQP